MPGLRAATVYLSAVNRRLPDARAGTCSCSLLVFTAKQDVGFTPTQLPLDLPVILGILVLEAQKWQNSRPRMWEHLKVIRQCINPVSPSACCSVWRWFVWDRVSSSTGTCRCTFLRKTHQQRYVPPNASSWCYKGQKAPLTVQVLRWNCWNQRILSKSIPWTCCSSAQDKPCIKILVVFR